MLFLLVDPPVVKDAASRLFRYSLVGMVIGLLVLVLGIVSAAALTENIFFGFYKYMAICVGLAVC